MRLLCVLLRCVLVGGWWLCVLLRCLLVGHGGLLGHGLLSHDLLGRPHWQRWLHWLH